MRANAARPRQATQWTGTGQIFEVVAGRAHPDAFAEDVANRELLPNQGWQRNAAGDDVAPGLLLAQLDAAGIELFEIFGLDQGQLPAVLAIAIEARLERVAVACQPLACDRLDLDRGRSSVRSPRLS